MCFVLLWTHVSRCACARANEGILLTFDLFKRFEHSSIQTEIYKCRHLVALLVTSRWQRSTLVRGTGTDIIVVACRFQSVTQCKNSKGFRWPFFSRYGKVFVSQPLAWVNILWTVHVRRSPKMSLYNSSIFFEWFPGRSHLHSHIYIHVVLHVFSLSLSLDQKFVICIDHNLWNWRSNWMKRAFWRQQSI